MPCGSCTKPGPDGLPYVAWAHAPPRVFTILANVLLVVGFGLAAANHVQVPCACFLTQRVGGRRLPELSVGLLTLGRSDYTTLTKG